MQKYPPAEEAGLLTLAADNLDVLINLLFPQCPYPTSLLLAYPTLPYPTLPYPTLPDPTLPNPTLPYPTLPYPTLPCPTLPYPTLLYPTPR